MEELTHKIVTFINGIGIPCQPEETEGDDFLPGIFIKKGRILYHPQHMKYPGDLLHEAGHLAILRPEDRREAENSDKMFGDLSKEGAEMAAIAWSWAALQHIDLDPSVLFHEHGYKGGSPGMISNFISGKYVGVPMLQWMGMTTGQNSHNEPGAETYPKMKHWLRQ